MAQGRNRRPAKRCKESCTMGWRPAGRKLWRREINGLTEEQIQAVTPRDMFRLVAVAAMRSGNLPLILQDRPPTGRHDRPQAGRSQRSQPAQTNQERLRLRSTMREITPTVGWGKRRGRWSCRGRC